jgi:membrane protein DedA with SNARE-associated domain
LAVHVHEHFHGPRLDYVTIGAGAAASWVGVPGAGEAILITAGVLAAHHRLDIAEVVLVAWLGATLGGIAGWLIGLTAGRAVVTRGGPLRKWRLKALAGGERFFSRYGVLAVLFTPSWVAGVNRMRWPLYMAANAVSALAWALGVGIGAYLVGPSVAELVGDVGLVGALTVAVLAAAGAGAALLRRRAGH